MNLYLSQMEKSTKQDTRFGFKVLANQFDAWPDLVNVLKDRGYAAIYLERKNIVRLIISGIVAKRRGIYNLKNHTPIEESFEIDLDDFEMRVRWAQEAVEKEKKRLKDWGFDINVITYEDFVGDRTTFFKRICSLLDVPDILPQQTDYSIMISDLSKTVANYDDLVARVHSMGFSDML